MTFRPAQVARLASERTSRRCDPACLLLRLSRWAASRERDFATVLPPASTSRTVMKDRLAEPGREGYQPRTARLNMLDDAVFCVASFGAGARG